MANKVTIDVEARFIDNVTDESKAASKAVEGIGKEADQAQKKIDKLGRKKASPTIDADDSKLLKKLRSADAKVSKLGKTKANVVLKAMDKASGVVTKVLNKTKGLAGATYSFFIRAKDSAALASIKNITAGAKSIAGKTWHAAVKIKDYATAPLTKLKNMLFSIKSLVLAITAGLAAKQLVLNPISLADQYSSAKIGFSTLLGESAGQQMMNDLDVFAKATPFKSSEVISQTQRMLAMGWTAENIITDMTTIGDAAAATGKGEQGLQQIVTALAQIKSKGKLSTEELNQLAEAGISAKRYLAEGLGYGSGDSGIAKMTKDLESGAIGSEKAVQALLAGMKEYQGMMDKTANETVKGLWSQIVDTFEINIFRRWGQGLQDGAKKSFGSIVALLDEADSALNKFGDTIYEVGKTVSNWLADKLEKAVARITEITGSFEFKEASLGEKISMLWRGVIVDPLKEWWEGGGQQKTAETAGKIGKWMGETLTKGILAILGVTDIFEDTDLSESGGASVAQSFARGFVDSFDVSAITDKLVDAIGNVWNALPTWAKILVGGYGAAKIGSGINSLIGGATSLYGNVRNIIGSTGNAMVSGSGTLGMLSGLGYKLTGGGGAGAYFGAGLSGGMAALGGAGAIAAGASAIKGGLDLYGSYKAFRSGDKVEGKAKAASGGTALGGVAAGAAAGAALGSIIPGLGTAIGALVGAGVGGVAGWIGGDKWADNIREAKFEVEGTAKAIEEATTEEEKLAALNKAAWESMKSRMGDIKLSASEIERVADQIVWGDDLGKFEQFNSAVQSAEANLKSLKTAAENTNKWMWKASLGVKFNEDEIESITASFDEYISAAKSYVENKHYEFTAAVSLLVDVESEEGKSIISSGNAFYNKMQEDLAKAGDDLGDALAKALKDGIISADEQEAITAAQQKIASITEKISNAETKAELELVKLKFGSGKLSLESFDSFMTQMETTLNERINANDKAFKASVSSLQLQLEEGAISQEEYDKQLKTLMDGYTAKVDKIKAEIMGVELDIIGDAYEDILGKDAAEKLQTALEKSLAEGIHPKEWTTEEAERFLGVDDLKDDTAKAIATMLGGVADQIELVEVDGKLLLDLGIETESNTEKKVEKAVDNAVPDKTSANVGVNILSTWNVDKFHPTMGTFGIQNSYTFTPTINFNPKVGNVTTPALQKALSGDSARGNIWYPAGSNAKGFASGGLVRGGARLIKVAEEGSPEMIIPLSSQRRDRALKLWAKAGQMMDVPGFARGGLTNRGADEGLRFHRYGADDSASGQTVQVDVGGITLEIHVNGTDAQSIAEAIKAQVADIAEDVAGVMAEAFSAQFENTPVRGGVA